MSENTSTTQATANNISAQETETRMLDVCLLDVTKQTLIGPCTDEVRERTRSVLNEQYCEQARANSMRAKFTFSVRAPSRAEALDVISQIFAFMRTRECATADVTAETHKLYLYGVVVVVNLTLVVTYRFEKAVHASESPFLLACEGIYDNLLNAFRIRLKKDVQSDERIVSATHVLRVPPPPPAAPGTFAWHVYECQLSRILDAVALSALDGAVRNLLVFSYPSGTKVLSFFVEF